MDYVRISDEHASVYVPFDVFNTKTYPSEEDFWETARVGGWPENLPEEGIEIERNDISAMISTPEE